MFASFIYNTILIPRQRQTLDKESQFAIPSPKETPLSTPAPSPEYTPPESEESAQQLTVLSTPERTPTTAVTSDESLSSEPNEKNQNQQDNADDQVDCHLELHIGSGVFCFSSGCHDLKFYRGNQEETLNNWCSITLNPHQFSFSGIITL